MAVKRLTETNGWVDAVIHHKTTKHNNGMAVPAGVYGAVMHTMVGNLPGTDDMFMNSSREASAHFGIAQDGTVIQWVSIRGGVAWHCADGNYNWYGIEHADNGNPGNPLTEAQINASALLVELLSRDDVGRFALQATNSTTGEGYGVHYMGGAAWGGHSCPQLANGSGPRSGQRAEIIRRAKVIREYGQYPAPVYAVNPVMGLVVMPRYTQADVSWQAAAGATSYRIIVKVKATGEQVFKKEQAGTKITLLNLRRGAEYTVSVLALPATTADEMSGRAKVSFTTKK
jgi:N-acetylmuramoyl-L-alanine amidase